MGRAATVAVVLALLAVARAAEPPKGWNCDAKLYDDGNCHCACGAWDVDCDKNGKSEDCDFEKGKCYPGCAKNDPPTCVEPVCRIAWPLILTIVFMVILIIIGAIYLLIWFAHPTDANAAYLPKAVVVAAFSFACYNVLMLPLDVANREVSGGLDLTLLLFINYWIVTVALVVVIPFAIFFYESESPEDNTVYTQTTAALRLSIVTIIVFGALIAILYALVGTAEIPVEVTTSTLIPANATEASVCTREKGRGGSEMTCQWAKTSLKIRVTLIVYIISMLSFFGLIFFIVFGGIGMVALPMDLINDFVYREESLTPAEYAARKVALGARAASLLQEGTEITQDERIKAGKRSRKQKKRYNKFKKDVYLLEKDYEKMQNSWQSRRHPYMYFVDLALGILGAIISFLWFLHIILFMSTRNYITPFLNNIFIGLTIGEFTLFGAVAYSVFVFYLLVAVIKGNIKFGLRLVLFTIHPMKLKGTLVNSLLFNAGLILLCSVSVVQFCTSAFSIYTRLTAVENVFDIQINNLQGIGYVFEYSVYALLAVMAVTGVYLFFWPSDRHATSDDDSD